ncbi:hypothetical protein [Methanogenium organophilum]|uniref:Uncharacterized protein n=1 Tax=Methanogenium organophilum TaxID=2199 RepID=A0A9X9S2P9_METOG|nr:hypothetical protein [Methanogenium organophilum]WAI00692.1 hypothetical protein OU421_09685 [Methanogenium organophilum]
MDNFFLWMFSVFTILFCLVTTVGAADVVLDNDSLLVNGVNDSIGLGAFSVVLTYSENVSIQSVEGESGFMVASNIQNNKYETFIAGISSEGLTGDIPVASVSITGSGDIEVFVRELVNVKGDPISFTNAEFVGVVPAPASGGEETIHDISVSDYEETPLEQQVTTTAKTPEATVKETETPVDTIINTPASPTQATSGDNDISVVPDANENTVPPTQSPFNIIVVLIAIGSVYILKNKK